jgi:hypothetical protein|tara:strand:- start:2206 stop:3333 length:1128 start_codon:yes stop_codon:yes gene_type:complete
MAYNILKGTVEGSVDQHADQEIAGVKVFKSTISASVFYDTDAGSPCATVKDVAITQVEGSRQNALLTYGADKKAIAHFNLVFENDVLHTSKVCAQQFEGAATGLRDIPADQFSDTIRAEFLDTSHGLANIRGSLQVKSGEGISTTEAGTNVCLAANSGLSFRSRKLTVNPKNCLSISTDGQNLSDADTLVVFDDSRGATYNTTLSNLCDSYLRTKMPQPDGPPGSIQIKSTKGFQSSTNLAYDVKSDTLSVGGQTITDTFKTSRTAEFEGSVIYNITTTKELKYHVQPDDYTILADTSDGITTVTLPPACNSRGRMLIIKKINGNRYKLNSHLLKVEVEEGEIDFQRSMTIKHCYSTRTLQSDGSNWWIVSRVGS